MKLKTRKLVMSTLVGSIAVAIAGLAVADVTIRLRPNQDFVVKDKGGADNFRVKVDGAGVEVPRGPLDIKNITSGGEIKFYEGSGGGGNSFTIKSPNTLAADVIFTLPNTEGAAGQVLQTDGKGMLSWKTVTVSTGIGCDSTEKVVGLSATAVSTDSGCDSTEEVVDLSATAGGRTWMDRNLGASRVAESYDDTLSYGALFQWGRGRDGHECSWRATHPGPVASSAVGEGNLWDGKFIRVATNSGIKNWLSNSDDTLWGDGSKGGTTKGPNDPCPTGYQVPNENELLALKIRNRRGAFDVLKLPAAGSRVYTGDLIEVDTHGRYWSSTVRGSSEARYFVFARSTGNMNNLPRTRGMSVRCIKKAP